LGNTQVPHRIDTTLDKSYKDEALLTLQAGFVRMRWAPISTQTYDSSFSPYFVACLNTNSFTVQTYDSSFSLYFVACLNTNSFAVQTYDSSFSLTSLHVFQEIYAAALLLLFLIIFSFDVLSLWHVSFVC